ncbi:MAG TPA: hypothetical protein VFL82_03890, partial [Thermomicrobiales bacterium]|nr:hypothetical protein [Thermomicrobiales bacterium]
MEKGPRPLGIVLTPAEVQDEGLDRVLDNIQRAGATAILTTIGVATPAQPGQGRREPPFDVAGQARLLDRPLWGQRELWIHTYTPHAPDPAIWADVPFSPPTVAPPELRVDVPRQIIDEARRRGLRAEIQIDPYSLPGAMAGFAVDSGSTVVDPGDRPRRIDGTVADRAVSGTGCLNNPRVRALGRARLRQALAHYPDVDGIFLDWPEYTTYFLEDCFVCFCDHCQAAATAAGYDWPAMKRDTLALWERLHRLTNNDLQRVKDPADWAFIAGETAISAGGVAELLRFKAATVRAVATELRTVMDDHGAASVALGLNGFATPWSRVTGMDYRTVSQVCQQTRCKLFTFHWPMITRWWSETLLA